MAGFLRHQFARAALVVAGQPAPPLLPRALPVAIAASLAAHGVMAGVMAVHLLAKPSPSPSSTGPAVRARAMTVSLASRAPLATSPAPVLMSPAPVPRKPRGVAKASVPSTVTASAKVAAPVAPLAAPPSPVAAPPLPSSAPQFAGLFSPIIRSPLGRGGWGRTGQSSPPGPPLNAQQQREQAALAWQMAVHGRLTSLAEASRDTARAMSCKVTIDTDQRIGEVECAEAADQAAPWTYLQGVLTAGTVADSAQRLCYTLADRQLFAQACATDAPTP